MDITELRADVERLAARVAEQPSRPADRDAWIAAALALRDALTVIRETTEDLDFDLATRLAEENVVTKRCAGPGCRRWIVVTPRRRTCSAKCRVALSRVR